jgi:hypothetical protein
LAFNFNDTSLECALEIDQTAQLNYKKLEQQFQEAREKAKAAAVAAQKTINVLH